MAATPPSAPATRRRRMSRADRERQMIAVAEQVFGERGYRAASMDDIAERVGVSKPMLYEYFGSKDGLMRATIAHHRAALLAATTAAVAAGRDSEDKLRRGLVAYFAFAEEHRQAWAVLRSEAALLAGATVGEAAGEIEATRRQQTEFMAAGMATFLGHLGPVRLEGYAEILVGACERLTLWRDRHPEVTAAQAAQYVLDLVWPGLAALA
jgi:AcrR family transcriptional regulator